MQPNVKNNHCYVFPFYLAKYNFPFNLMIVKAEAGHINFEFHDYVLTIFSYINTFYLLCMFQVRKSIHMHSFTFDFHLRTIHQLVSGKPTFRKGFNLVLFLDDFMMYYNKGPNFARNAIHRGSIEIPCTQEWSNDIQVNT